MLSVRVLIAEDVHMVRGALVALLELEQDMEVVAAVDRGEMVVPAAIETRPDVAVLDIGLVGVDGITAAMELKVKLPDCRTLILTSLGRPGTVRRAMAAQVSGFLLKDAPAHQLAQAVRSVAAGRRVVDPELALAAWEASDSPLSPRETQVLRMAAQGAEPEEIADELSLTTGTVRNYLTAIVDKLQARNRIDAILIAEEAGWLP